MLYDHTERFLATSASWLKDATVDGLSENGRIDSAFLAGYNALQAVWPHQTGKMRHPDTNLILQASDFLKLKTEDGTLGVALATWAEYGKYRLDPPPVALRHAIAWVDRVRKAAVELQS